MDLTDLIAKIVLTLVSSLTMGFGVKTLVVHFNSILKSKPQFWFYIMSLLSLVFATVLVWIPYDHYDIVALFVYSGCNISQASFLWCQLLNFILLYKSLSDYTVVMSSCEKLESANQLESKIEKYLYQGLFFLLFLEVMMIVTVIAYVFSDLTLSLVSVIWVCISVGLSGAIGLTLCVVGIVITVKLHRMV